VVYDGPGSGSFVPALVPPVDAERIVVTSAGASEPAHFLLDGEISFSKFFWTRVLNGSDVRYAFRQASDAISFTGSGQTPVLEDNGNGVGNEKSDGQLAQDYRVGAGIMLAGDDPLIGSACPPQILTGGTSAPLWVDQVTTTGEIAQVWAVIAPPVSPSDPMILALSPAGGDRYEGTCDDLATPGVYGVSFYAMDVEGAVSMPIVTHVEQTGPDAWEEDDAPASANVIVLAEPQIHNFHDAGDPDWVKFYAWEDTPYEISTTDLGINADAVIRLYDTDGTSLLVERDNGWTGEDELLSWSCPADGMYYVQITDYAGSYGSGTEYTLMVTIPGGLFDIYGVVGIVRDTGGAPIPGAVVRVVQTGSAQQTTSEGAYALAGLVSGQSYTVEASYGDATDSESVNNPQGSGEDWLQVDFTLALGFTLTMAITPTEGGSVACDPDKAIYAPGDTVEMTATASANYRFDCWSGDLGGEVNPDTVTMDADKTVTAQFIGPLGDSDGSGYIDYVDLFAFSAAWHKSEGEPGYDPLCDFNGDGSIDDVDAFAFRACPDVIYVIETSGATDTTLALVDVATGEELARDADSGAGLSARIVWTAPAGSDVGIRVTGNDPGAYTLALEALIREIVLSESGLSEQGVWNVIGRALDSEGVGIAEAKVVVSSSAFEPCLALTDETGAFTVKAPADALPIGVCAYAAGGESALLAFAGVEEETRYEVSLNLASLSDLATTYGDSFLADAAYCQRWYAGTPSAFDRERYLRGRKVLGIVSNRLWSKVRHTPGLVGAERFDVIVIYDGPPALTPPDAPVVKASGKLDR
jgi:hypothetical protein